MQAPEQYASLGFAAIDWIEHYLVHGPGDVQGQPIELDDEFAAFIIKAYEVHARGDRKVRRAFLSRSKGRSKSGLAAMLVCFEALGPARFDHWAEASEVSDWGYEYEEGEPVGKPLTYAEVLNVATEEGQAGNTYDAVHYMLDEDTCSENLLADFGKLDVGLTRVNLPNKRGFIEPVTSADTSKDGGKSTFIVADETHLWTLGRLKRLHGIMTRNLLKRKAASGWMLETSTMYAQGENSVAEGTHAYAKRAGDKTLLFDHRQASDKWDLAKRSDRLKALREAYGPASAWMNLEAIADSWDDPQVSEEDFRRYWLNQPVSTEAVVTDVFGAGHWIAGRGEVRHPEKPAAIGVAVSVDRHHASIAAASLLTADGEPVYVAPVDRREGTAWLVAEVARIQTQHECAVLVDEKGPTSDLIDDLQRAGVRLTLLDLGGYADACAEFFDRVRSGALIHPGNEWLDAAVAGASWRAAGERQVWGRRKSSSDVSMLEAATLAARGATHSKSVYETRGLVTL